MRPMTRPDGRPPQHLSISPPRGPLGPFGISGDQS